MLSQNAESLRPHKMSPVLSTKAEIRFATRQDLEPICRLLSELFPRSVAFWRSMMNYPWLSDDDKPHYGAVLMVGGKPCGFAGVMFADRAVDGRLERFAGGFGWCVQPEYRKFSLGLLSHLRDPQYTWTNLTCREEMVPLFLKLGYSFADTRKLVCYPSPSMFLGRGSLRVVPVEEVTSELLGREAYQIFSDHFMCTVRRTVFEARGKNCLVITRSSYAPNRFRPLPAMELLYSSDREFFAQHYRELLPRLLKRGRAVALLAEERLLSFTPKGAGTLPTGPLFKSSRVPAAKVDSLYTELVLLT